MNEQLLAAMFGSTGSPEDTPKPNPLLEALVGFTPVLGDIKSGSDAIKAAMQGQYGEAALNAVGLLPFIPSLGGIMKNGSPIRQAMDTTYDAGKRKLIQEASQTGTAQVDQFTEAVRKGYLSEEDAVKLRIISRMMQSANK